MRQTFIVTYDVCHPKRLRRVFKLLKGYGVHLQLSVFRCDLDARTLHEVRGRLGEVIHDGEDQVLFVDVGPSDGRAATSIRALGKPYAVPAGLALVV